MSQTDVRPLPEAVSPGQYGEISGHLYLLGALKGLRLSWVTQKVFCQDTGSESKRIKEIERNRQTEKYSTSLLLTYLQPTDACDW